MHDQDIRRDSVDWIKVVTKSRMAGLRWAHNFMPDPQRPLGISILQKGIPYNFLGLLNCTSEEPRVTRNDWLISCWDLWSKQVDPTLDLNLLRRCEMKEEYDGWWISFCSALKAYVEFPMFIGCEHGCTWWQGLHSSVKVKQLWQALTWLSHYVSERKSD